jgi:hypothetical protein
MADSPTTRRLKQIRSLIVGGKLSDDERKRLRIQDVDGSLARLDGPDAVAVLDRLIEAAEAAA